jgi:hypothetical protein
LSNLALSTVGVFYDEWYHCLLTSKLMRFLFKLSNFKVCPRFSSISFAVTKTTPSQYEYAVRLDIGSPSGLADTHFILSLTLHLLDHGNFISDNLIADHFMKVS